MNLELQYTTQRQKCSQNQEKEGREDAKSGEPSLSIILILCAGLIPLHSLLRAHSATPSP